MTSPRLDLEASRLERRVYSGLYWVLLGLVVVFGFVGWFASLSWLFWLGVFGCLVGFYASFVEPYLITVKRFRLALVPRPKQWVRIAFLSDMHAGMGKGPVFWKRVVARTRALRPDLMLLGGDAVEQEAEPVRLLAPFASLEAPLGKFFLKGNHDFLDDPERVRAQFLAWGYQELTNRSVILRKGGEAFQLVGLDDTWHGDPELALLRREATRPRVLVTHEPDLFLDLKEGDADVILTGHTHGGQIRLPFYGPVMRLPLTAPQWLDRGLKTWRGMPAIISQGLGEANVRARLFCPPQIVVVEVGI
jgi:predicted MPP superfamily phosphohydrolase